MRRMLLFGATVLALFFGLADAQALTPNEQAAYSALSAQLQSASAAVWTVEPSMAPIRVSDARAAAPTGDARSLAKGLASALRTGVLLGFVSLLIGLSAIAVKALWVLDRTEHPLPELGPSPSSFEREWLAGADMEPDRAGR